MADHIIRISGNDVFRPKSDGPVKGGHSRVVPSVPIGDDGSTAPCIWKSPKKMQITLQDGSKVPARECLLLISKSPPTVMRAEVAEAAWATFGECLVEW